MKLQIQIGFPKRDKKVTKYFVLGLIFLLLEVSAFNLIGVKKVNAVDSWIKDGVILGDTIRVPVAWCSVIGSPAASSPNIPNPWGGSDTTTEDVLWRRHERVTDNIFVDQAGITFRSAINDPFHSSFTFPKIADPYSTPGVLGDFNLDSFDEEGLMINACLSEWEKITKDKSGNFPGILAINVNRFTDNAGTVKDTLGFGSCLDQYPQDNVCDDPYDGLLFVIDNSYMIPGLITSTPVIDTCPPPEIIWNKDPFDQALGHEFGHTLVLGHRNADSLALMNRCQLHGGPGGMVNNIELNNGEVINVRASALQVPGHEIDPYQKVFASDIVRSIRVDDIKESKTLNSFEDISVVKITLNEKQNTVAYGIQLLGIIPEKIKQSENKLQYWTLLDLDNNQTTGGNNIILENIGVPPNNFTGAELVINMKFINNANITNSNLTGSSWLISDNGNNFTSNVPSVNFKLQTFKVHDIPLEANSSLTKKPLYDTVNAIVNNSKNFAKLNQPFTIQTLVTSNGTIVDLLKDSQKRPIVLSNELYPQCAAKDNAIVGKNATVSVSGLLPDKGIHTLLGPRFVANGTSDNFGNSTIEFQVPQDTSAGLHLITVGVDKTALTADCEILVNNSTNIK
jgi:hypothetical protein